jgi:TolB-like protein/DNA-binding winged helix-turn-helix (wHTH) protein/Tfp pilus assembly protein PilF
MIDESGAARYRNSQPRTTLQAPLKVPVGQLATANGRPSLMSTTSPVRKVRFGPFELDLSCNELHKYGHRIRIQQQPLRVLALFLEHPGDLVTRDELRSRLWPDGLFVDFEHGLNRSVNKLRRALLDSADSPRYIETLPSLGYRFIAPVEVVQNGKDHGLSDTEALAGPTALPERISVPNTIPGNIPSTNSSQTRRTPSRSVVIAMLAAALLFVAATIGWQKLARRPAPVGQTMMVVLPFENLTGDPGQDYFCDGMTEELTAQFGNFDPGRLGVIARTTAMHYKGTSKTIKEIAAELGVRYVVEGSVRRVKSRIRLTTQLIEAGDQRHLWARTFDRESSDILGLQRDISIAIVQEIPSYLGTAREAQPQHRRPNNSEAYLDYLRGRFFWNKRNNDGLNKSISYFKRAIAEDPQYAQAYAGLADAYLVLGGDGTPHEIYQQGAASAANALTLDPALAEAHTSLAYFKFIDEWDWEGADREFRRALSLDPGYATAHHWYALYLSAMNRMPESISEIEKAVELDPLSTAINSNVGAIYYQAGEYEKSRIQLRKTLELDPNFVPAHGYLGYIDQITGRYDDALAEYREAQQIAGNDLAYVGDVGRVYVLMNRKEEGEKLLQRASENSQIAQQFSPYSLCLIYSSLGDVDAGLKWLEKSIEIREFTATEFTHDMRIENLRRDPRFVEIRRQFNIPDPNSHSD